MNFPAEHDINLCTGDDRDCKCKCSYCMSYKLVSPYLFSDGIPVELYEKFEVEFLVKE